jgi:hypothetical protein
VSGVVAFEENTLSNTTVEAGPEVGLKKKTVYCDPAVNVAVTVTRATLVLLESERAN